MFHVIKFDPAGNNWDKVKDTFTLPLSGPALRFAALSWQFDIFPNPGIAGEKYRIVLNVEQNATGIFTREYEKSIATPDIVTEDGIFVVA